MQRLLLLGLVAACSCAGVASQEFPQSAILTPDRVYSIKEASGETTVVAPYTAVAGVRLTLDPPLAGVQAQECGAACRQRPDCGWFQYCRDQGGCPDGAGNTLPHQECHLLAADCSVQPTLAASGWPVSVTSGYPARRLPQRIYGVAETPGQGIIGGDFDCAMSRYPGKCVANSTLDAISICMSNTLCRAVVVFMNGTDGCSSSVAVLKSEGLSSANAFVAPGVATLQQSESQLLASNRLYDSEGEVVLPTAAELAATPAAGGSGSCCPQTDTAWLGCVLGSNAVMAGEAVAVLDGVQSAEACCRSCRERAPGGSCNVFNYCEQEGGCSFQDTETSEPPMNMTQGQCELRFQELVGVTYGWPPVLLGKGPTVPFTAGAPMAVWGPEIPGFQRLVGRGLFTNGRYNCTGSLRPELQECVKQGSREELAAACLQDPQCAALVLKPGGLLGLQSNAAVLKSTASTSQITLNPAAVLYVRDSAPAGLPAGAIAGIAAGAVVAVAALFGAAWLLVRRKRRRQGGQAAEPRKSMESAGGGAEAGKPAGGAAAAAAAAAPSALQQQQQQQDQLQHHLQQQHPRQYPQQQQAQAQPSSVIVGAMSGSKLVSPFADGASAAAFGAASTASGSLELRWKLPPAIDTPRTDSHATLDQPDTRSSLMLHGSSEVAAHGYSGSSQAAGAGRAAAAPHLACPGSGAAAAAAVAAGMVAAGPAPVRSSSLLGSSPPVFGSVGDFLPAPATHQQQQLPRGRGGGGSGGAAAIAAALTSGFSTPADSPSSPLSLSSNSTLPATDHAGGGATPLPELVQHVALQEAEAGGSLEISILLSDHLLVSVETLPARLREWVVPCAAITYMRWPSGKLQEIGRGASAKVYKALYNGEAVAAKEIDIGQSSSMQEAFLTEALQLQALRHPHVVGFYGVTLAGSKGVVLMELCEGRDLHSAIELRAAGSNQRLFGWHRRGRRVAYEVAKALNYLHIKGVVHMDVKSSNVLLTASGTAKLADVAFSRLLAGTYLSDLPLIGTFAWIAPEVLLGGRQCTQAVDLFSFGVLLWEIITGERPQRGNLRMPQVPAECPQEACDLMMECLSEDPADRPTAQQALHRLGRMLERPVSGRTLAAAPH